MTEAATAPRAARGLVGSTVLQVVPALSDDPFGHAVLDIAMGLLRSGARSLVAGGGGALVGELQALGGEWLDFDLTTASPFRRRRIMQDVREMALGERVDLIHAHGADIGRAISAAAANQKRVAFVTTHLALPAGGSWFSSRDGLAPRSLVIAPSEYAADLLAARQRIARDRIVVIPRPVDTEVFDPERVDARRISALRTAWRVGPEDRIVLAPGRLQRSKGFGTLIDAVRMLLTGGLRRTVFVIAADHARDEAFEAELKSAIAAQGLARVMRQAGHCDDMPAAYAAADFVVFASERGGSFPSSAAEAVAMGRPIVAAEVGALPEMIDAVSGTLDDRTGWLFEPANSQQLARALAEALALDRDAWTMMSERARHAAEVRFARGRVAAATLALYDALIEAAPHAGAA